MRVRNCKPFENIDIVELILLLLLFAASKWRNKNLIKRELRINIYPPSIGMWTKIRTVNDRVMESDSNVSSVDDAASNWRFLIINSRKNCYNENHFNKIYAECRQACTFLLRAEILWKTPFFLSCISQKRIPNENLYGEIFFNVFCWFFGLNYEFHLCRARMCKQMNDLYKTNGLQLIRKVLWNWLVFVFSFRNVVGWLFFCFPICR